MSVEKVWESNELTCVVRKVPFVGDAYYYNGYVNVPRSHSLYGICYDICYNEIFNDLDIHGGVTFSDTFSGLCDCQGIEGWWIGFDTNHFGDKPHNSNSADYRVWYEGLHCWSFEEVVKETEYLAEQIAKFGDV